MKRYFPLILIIIALLTYFFINSKKVSSPPISNSEADLIVYWGEGCPHCENVKKFVKENNLDSKIKILYKEVYNNTGNQKELESTVQKCPEIDSSRGIGVPLAFDTKNSKCLYGDTPIIEWLKTK